jgi:hypothetical protein
VQAHLQTLTLWKQPSLVSTGTGASCWVKTTSRAEVVAGMEALGSTNSSSSSTATSGKGEGCGGPAGCGGWGAFLAAAVVCRGVVNRLNIASPS